MNRSDVTFPNASNTAIDTGAYSLCISHILEIGGCWPNRTGLKINYSWFLHTEPNQHVATPPYSCLHQHLCSSISPEIQTLSLSAIKEASEMHQKSPPRSLREKPECQRSITSQLSVVMLSSGFSSSHNFISSQDNGQICKMGSHMHMDYTLVMLPLFIALALLFYILYNITLSGHKSIYSGIMMKFGQCLKYNCIKLTPCSIKEATRCSQCTTHFYYTLVMTQT